MRKPIEIIFRVQQFYCAFKNGENQKLSFSEFSVLIHVYTVMIAKGIT